MESSKVRGKTKFSIEAYIEYAEEKTAVLTKKFADSISLSQ